MKKSLYSLTLLLTLLSTLTSCRNKEYRAIEGMVWNTTFHITYCGAPDLTDSVYATLRRVEMSVSAFAPHSLVSRINRCETDTVDTDFAKVYREARDVWQLSSGYFDPTLSPLINAYGFGYQNSSTPPDQSHTDSILQFVGMEKTSLNGTHLVKQDPRTEFNFSAIAKGYGCDQVGEMFQRAGVDDYMVEIGGEIALHGRNPEGGLWRISIDKPVVSNTREIHESQTVLTLTDCGIATSGNYRNYHEQGGRRVGHTFDPKTGRPALTDVLSATVIAPTCMRADALATACMSMGSERARLMADAHRLKVMLITPSGVWTSPSWPK